VRATKQLSEAEPLCRRALAISEKSYGPDHPTVAIRLNNLAELLRATNGLSEAEPLYRRALAIDEKSYGPDHPEVATDLNALAQLLRATNRLSEAEPLYRRAVGILAQFMRATGHRHPNFEAARANYAVALTELGRSEAEVEDALR
jgi:tetratricopeptide (TPR) repeat protein